MLNYLRSSWIRFYGVHFLSKQTQLTLKRVLNLYCTPRRSQKSAISTRISINSGRHPMDMYLMYMHLIEIGQRFALYYRVYN